MKVNIFETTSYFKVVINDYRPLVSFSDEGSVVDATDVSTILPGFSLKENHDETLLEIPIDVGSHILGLGERAFGIDRKRKRLSSVNTDPGGYRREEDPIYLPMPFFVKVTRGVSQGVFVNYPGEMIFDLGQERYDFISVKVKSDRFEFFVFKSPTVKGTVRDYIELTGRTFLPPRWAIGHTVSRYTYYPENQLKEVIDRYAETTRIEAVYLDIDYMDHYRLFTWNENLFSNGFLDNLHKKGVKVITIVNPSVKLDQNFPLFGKWLGHYMEKSNGDLYTGPMWPGTSVFPDFMNDETRELWKEEIRNWSRSGVDGIWLDMNEPTVLTDDHLFDPDALHKLDNGEQVKHGQVRNLYPYLQCKATYEALSEGSQSPFILTRSGYSGVQRYAAVWTGDNITSWDDLKLQITTVTGLSISGVTVVGCDLGGFIGDGDPDLVAAYYRMALFFPLYRNHKDVKGRDQEVYMLPSYAREDIVNSIDLRYKFLDHIYSLIHLSHSDGTGPVITPLPYEFPSDENSYFAEDQYMIGEHLMYAPQINRDLKSRRVYIPEGIWYNFWNWKRIEGPGYINTEESYPVFVRNNGCLLYDGKILVTGKGKFDLFVKGDRVTVESDGTKVSVSGSQKIPAEIIQ